MHEDGAIHVSSSDCHGQLVSFRAQVHITVFLAHFTVSSILWPRALALAQYST